MTTRSATSPLADLDARWRPAGSGPTCGFRWDGNVCTKSGPHYCEPRADRVVGFFRDLLVHTKGPHKRNRFVLKDWQEWEIVRPLFGEVRWTDEWADGLYVRRYTTAHVVVSRKNGKSELAAGIQLYLLIGDDEESAEVYSAAKDTKQAGKVFEPALRMMQLSEHLRKRLRHIKNARRIIDEKSASHYEVITADALGELGHNPHGFNLDEVLSQPDGSLWEAMATAEGARAQPLFFSTTTETNVPVSFGADLIDEAERVQEDPKRSPHTFAFVRKLPSNDQDLERLRARFPGHPDLPVSTDPWDEANWRWANPALDDFLSREALRRASVDAKNKPAEENGFRQFRLNQRQQQRTRWLSLHHWDQQPNMQMVVESDLAGRRCFGGLDLSSKIDITALCWDFTDDAGRHEAIWRFWLPEERLEDLDRHTAGKGSVWVRNGWLELTPGNVIDYERVRAQINADASRFEVVELAFDPWGSTQLANQLMDDGLEMVEFRQGYRSMSEPLKEWQKLIIEGRYVHGGNPVMRWMADNIVVRTDPNENIAIDKAKSHEKVDGPVASVMALGRSIVHEGEVEPFAFFA